MSSILYFLRFHKEQVLNETRKRIQNAIKREEQLNQQTLITLLDKFEIHIELAIASKIKTLTKTTLKTHIGKEIDPSLTKSQLRELWINSDENKAFIYECKEQMRIYIDKLKTRHKTVISKENARREIERKRNELILENKKWILERVEQENEQFQEEFRKYIAYIVADMFLNDKTNFLFNDFQTVGNFIPNYYYTLKIRPESYRKWILMSITTIKEEKGKDFFKGTYPKSSSPYEMLYGHFEHDSEIIKQIDRFYKKMAKEDFKTIFFEGVNNNPKFMEEWKKQRIRRLVGSNKGK